MKLNFKFSNLMGTAYRQGNVNFSPDGNLLFSPVGNKISVFDLKNNRSETLPIESNLNIRVVALSPCARVMIIVDEQGVCFYISLMSRTILHRIRLSKTIRDIKFSPDGSKFAVCRDGDVQLYRSPGTYSNQYTPLYLEAVFHCSHDVTTCLDWSLDSRLFLAGSSDSQSKVCSSQNCRNLYMTSLGGHMGPVVACFFEQNYDLFTMEKRGFLVRWEANLSADDLESGQFRKDDVEGGKIVPLKYEKSAKHSFRDSLGGANPDLTAAAYDKKNRLLLTGWANGSFVLHEMPEFNMIHNLSVSDQSVRSVSINSSGDWLAVACGSASIGQLLVWEWQSESYVMKQQSHAVAPECMSYSPDGSMIATGASDAKVKVWSVMSGMCIVTFSEHTGGISGVVWTQAGKAVLSASLDGTVRAFDLKRYRNFRTLVTPRPAQLSCVAVDSSGEIVAAGARDLFDVFVWSLQNGRLLEVLSGHEAPVSRVTFNPAHSVLATVSWDKTLRIWNVFEGKSATELTQLSHDGLDVAFSPDGERVCVVTMDAQISIFDWRNNAQVGHIEAKLDLDAGRGNKDEVAAKTTAPSKSFTTICYSADGDYILAGGQSKHVAIYHVKQQLLVKKFQITCNLSLDAVSDDLDRRKMTEFGRQPDSSDSEGEVEKLKLPGAKNPDPSQRSHRPEVRVTDVQFSPTARAWAACSTEGLLVYSLDETLLFDPFQLEMDITPDTVDSQISDQEYGRAILMALKLNQSELVTKAIEATPAEQIPVISQSISIVYAERLLRWFGSKNGLEATQNIELYLIWIKELLYGQGALLKNRNKENVDLLTALQQSITHRQQTLGNICDFNKYTLQFMKAVRESEF